MVSMLVVGWKANKHLDKIVQYFHECDDTLTIWKKIFGKGLSNEKCEEFKDIIMEQLVLLGAFNISDFVPLVKSFDLQGFIPKMKQLCSNVDEFFDEIIQDRLKEKHSNGIKDYLDVMLSIPKTYGLGDRLGDNVIKAKFNASYFMLNTNLFVELIKK
jgi:hypothetical protein